MSKLGASLRNLQRWEGLGLSWVSLRASWEGFRASWKGLKASWEGPKASWEALRAGWEAPGGDGRTDGWNFSPFYRTSSPVGAAALLLSETSQHQRSREREPLTS